MSLLDVHLGVFLGVHDGRNGNTEVGGRAPEVCIVEAMVSQCSRSISPPPNHWYSFSSTPNITSMRSRNAPPLATGIPSHSRVTTNGLSRSSPRPGWPGFWRWIRCRGIIVRGLLLSCEVGLWLAGWPCELLRRSLRLRERHGQRASRVVIDRYDGDMLPVT
jgi:hypothetical protein